MVHGLFNHEPRTKSHLARAKGVGTSRISGGGEGGKHKPKTFGEVKISRIGWGGKHTVTIRKRQNQHVVTLISQTNKIPEIVPPLKLRVGRTS